MNQKADYWGDGDTASTKPSREPDQEGILATALYLAQSYGENYFGMSAEDWVRDARLMRRAVGQLVDVAYDPAAGESYDA